MMTQPHTTFITLRTLSVNLAENSDSMVEIPKNQQQDAQATPIMNFVDWSAGRVAWNAPSIMEPSMRAWGLNQVTTQAVEMTFSMGTSTFVDVSMVS